MDRRERINDRIEEARAALEGKQAEIWTALPGIIQSYDPASMTVSVQPAISGKITGEDGASSPVNLPILPDVPVVFPTGGGFTLTFPIKDGDECLVVFSSRCIDGWWAGGGVQEPMESRMHDLSDGFAIVGPRHKGRALQPAADAENVQLRSDDGTNHVTITPDNDVQVVSADKVSVAAAGEITLNAPVIRIQGALFVTDVNGGATTARLIGDVDVQGGIASTQDQVAGGVSQMHHTHPGDSGGTTGEPK